MKESTSGDDGHQFQIFAFTDDRLADVLGVFTSSEIVKVRSHYIHLKKHLGRKGLNAKTIVVEKKYISRAYITDYSKYYATCFSDYNRDCDRVHFFDTSFNKKFFLKELFNLKSDFLKKHYLGCVVVKPIPDSIIGPTLLKTLPGIPDQNKKQVFYPVTQNHSINLFGKDLSVNTLPFQEQDNAVSACTSVALWSAFHQTSRLFQTPLPSPSEISERAGNLFMSSGRIYPNDGMDISQIGNAIHSLGLVSELRVSTLFHDNTSYATRLIYAYLKTGIPVILFTKSEKEASSGHAVTIVGYVEPEVQSTIEIKPDPKITLIADHTKHFFVHDDQVGPFASIKFQDGTSLSKMIYNEEGYPAVEQAWIHAIIIPVYPKIRIKFEDVFLLVQAIDTLLFEINFFKYELEWDVFLIESNSYKDEILNSKLENSIIKRKIFGRFPKYIWIARAQVKGQRIFDMIFDSTDSPRGFYCMDFLLHDTAARKTLLEFVDDARDFLITFFGRKAFDRIREEINLTK